MLIYLPRNLNNYGNGCLLNQQQQKKQSDVLTVKSCIDESSGTYACKYSTSLTIKEAMLMDVGKIPVKAW